MKIAMVGSGYVGLVSGACFADFGHDVVCIDKDQSKIDRLHAGIMPIYELGLDALVDSNVKAGRLNFTTDLGEGIAGADAIFIAVGTPSRRASCTIRVLLQLTRGAQSWAARPSRPALLASSARVWKASR
mgnify:CR=1 FL=1